jgi:hypothetical protein
MDGECHACSVGPSYVPQRRTNSGIATDLFLQQEDDSDLASAYAVMKTYVIQENPEGKK